MSTAKSDGAKTYFGDKCIDDLFEVHTGDFHATGELDPGKVPLISCGDTNNGLIGHFDIPADYTYTNAITVAYNGSWPLLAKYHPYTFGAKDDVAVLMPRRGMNESSQLYVAALLNRMTWRYNYGRKCFRKKLRKLMLRVPLIEQDNGETWVNEDFIAGLFPKSYHDYLPQKTEILTSKPSLKLRWQSFNISTLFDLERGDFHSIAALSPGEFMTISRVTENNGVVGYFERPDGAHLYPKGYITVSTVGGDAFVQLREFIATDNVIVCSPKHNFRITTMFFVAFALNFQKWRYGYGRQTYKGKLEQVNIFIPVEKDNEIDEDTIEQLVKQTSYWSQLEQCFGADFVAKPISRSDGQDSEQLALPL